jgi:hypothetical protein
MRRRGPEKQTEHRVLVLVSSLASTHLSYSSRTPRSFQCHLIVHTFYCLVTLARRVERYVRFSIALSTVLTRSPSYLRTYGIPVYSKHDLNRPQVYMMTAGAAYNYLEVFSSKRGAVKDAASCPLMKLLDELLLEICRLVVKVPGHSSATSPFWPTMSRLPSGRLVLRTLSLCHQCKTSLLYSR